MNEYTKMNNKKTRCVYRFSSKKKKIIFILVVIILFAVLIAVPVSADGKNDSELTESIEDLLGKLDMEELNEYLDSLTEEQKGFFGDGEIEDKILEIINGDFKMDYTSFFSAIGSIIFDRLDDLLPVFCVICSISILCGILTQFQSSFAERGTGKLISFVGYSSVLILILTSLTAVIEDCTSTVNSLQKQMQVIFPILLTLIATSGGSVSVAVYRPAVLFLSELIVQIIVSVVFPLAILMCVFNMAGNMSPEIKLKNFCSFFAGLIKWVLGVSLTIFTVFLTVQGITSATYDGLSFKAAKYAIGNTVPIIGGFLSGGLDVVVAGSVLIKNALGSCGILLMFSVTLIPFIQLVVLNLFLKLTAAVTEPLGEGTITGFLSSLSGTVNYFMAGLLAVGFMYFITILLLVCSSNSLF